MQPPSLKNDLIAVLKGLPRYLVGYFGGFIVFILSDLNITTLFVASVLAGVVFSSVWVGLLAFFAGYVVLKSIGGLGDAIFFSAQERNRVESQKIPAPTDPPPYVG